MPSQTPSQALQHGRSLIRELAARHHTANPRVFGSVLTGRDRPDSDLDVLVEPLPETTLFDLGRGARNRCSDLGCLQAR